MVYPILIWIVINMIWFILFLFSTGSDDRSTEDNSILPHPRFWTANCGWLAADSFWLSYLNSYSMHTLLSALFSPCSTEGQSLESNIAPWVCVCVWALSSVDVSDFKYYLIILKRINFSSPLLKGPHALQEVVVMPLFR